MVHTRYSGKQYIFMKENVFCVSSDGFTTGGSSS
jgi:hypothetical protein